MESIVLPDTWPVLTEMIIDDQDRLWIATTVEDMNVYEWWVLEETGELINRFEWPRSEPIEVVKNGFMYTRETDEMNLVSIVRCRINMENPKESCSRRQIYQENPKIEVADQKSRSNYKSDSDGTVYLTIASRAMDVEGKP